MDPLIGLILAGTSIMLVLVGFIVLFVLLHQRKMMANQARLDQMELAYQRELIAAAIQAQERERSRIGKDLHDDVGAMLSTIKMGVGQISKKLKRQPMQVEMVDETKVLINETIASVRRISKELYPATLEEFGLIDAMQEFADKLNRVSEIELGFEHHGQVGRLEKQQELALYRVFQEMINNAIKHADAAHINARLLIQPDYFILKVIDDGKGFDVEGTRKKKDKGLGLKSLESRITMLGAEIDYDSEIGKGTTITVTLPLM